jgi:hypothetical protein
VGFHLLSALSDGVCQFLEGRELFGSAEGAQTLGHQAAIRGLGWSWRVIILKRFNNLIFTLGNDDIVTRYVAVGTTAIVNGKSE